MNISHLRSQNRRNSVGEFKEGEGRIVEQITIEMKVDLDCFSSRNQAGEVIAVFQNFFNFP